MLLLCPGVFKGPYGQGLRENAGTAVALFLCGCRGHASSPQSGVTNQVSDRCTLLSRLSTTFYMRCTLVQRHNGSIEVYELHADLRWAATGTVKL